MPYTCKAREGFAGIFIEYVATRETLGSSSPRASREELREIRFLSLTRPKARVTREREG